MSELQKEGLLPTFTKSKPIDDDPRAELARNVLELYETENTKRLQESNRTGAPFSRINYRDAFDKYEKLHPTAPKVDKTAAELAKEDKERKEISSKNSVMNRNSSGDSGGDDRPQIPKTRRMTDMLPYLQQKYKVGR
jgi:hypothetical protein